MKFLADENITRKLVKLFKVTGYDIESVQSLNLRGIRNSRLLNKSIELERILITFDSDFKTELKKEYPGIIYIDIVPNIDSFVLPIIEKFLPSLKEIYFENNTIIVNQLGEWTYI